ncbi:HAD family hydrolase, partial [Leucobacter sp. M11]|uniref:HAD family hydrolase n=1 Tax=Leucobacter sp. M11 TaxID=2993565 RepID=UPI002D7E5AF5
MTQTTSRPQGTLPAAVLSDLDGTLLDTEAPWLELVAAVARERGATQAQAAAVSHAAEGATVAQTIAMLAGPDAGSAEVEAALAAELQERAEGAIAQARWIPGAREFLDRVAASNIPLALVTSSDRGWVDVIAPVLGLDRFATLVTADDVDRHKPHPEPYRLAAERLGLDIADCLALEDSRTGSTAAVDAGARTLLVRPERPEWLAAAAGWAPS